MVKACFFSAFLCLVLVSPLQAFSWETATSKGREYVTLQSFCTFYGFSYQHPGGNFFDTRSQGHTLRLKLGSPDMYLDGVHYVMSFPVEDGDHDWLVSRMDVIKLFEPVIRPTELADRHAIRGVVLDAGHGGSDNGAVSARGGMEKSYTRDTVDRLETILRNAGLKTVLTRRSDVFVDLYERAHIASLYPDYAFVSIHFNSATPEARGLETYCLSPRGAASTSSAYLTRSDIQKLPGNDYDGFNILLASMVHSEIIRLNPGDPTADRGVKRARFVVIKQNVLPAILVEGGFVSNRMEAARVNQPDYRQSLAEAVARGIIRFVNVMGNKRMALPETAPSPTAPVAPTPVPVLIAPSGLANDPAQKDNPVPSTNKTTKPPLTSTVSKPPEVPATKNPAVVAPTTNMVAQTTPPKGAASKTKKSKKKLAAEATATAPALSPAPASAPVSSVPATAPDATAPVIPGDSGLTDQVRNPVKPPSSTPNAPLDLAEPAPPTPAPGAEKAPAEPDEPPTVNIYPTTPSAAAKSDAPPSPPPAASPAASAPSDQVESTNANPNPATPGTP